MSFFANSYARNITIGPNVTYHNGSMYSAFNNCRNFNQPVTIPNGVTNMAYTFRNCANFNQPVTIPNGVTSMAYTFQNCANFNQALTIPDSVTSMSYVFQNTRVHTLHIGNGIANLANYFNAMNSAYLANVTFGANVTNLRGVFNNSGYVALREIRILSRNVANIQGMVNRSLKAAIANRLNIYVPAGSATNNLFVNKTGYVGAPAAQAINYTVNSANNCKYNSTQNLYVYWV